MHCGRHEKGEHGKHWRKYLDEGVVAMSGEIGHLRGLEDKDSIEQAPFELMPKNARSSRPTQTALAYDQPRPTNMLLMPTLFAVFPVARQDFIEFETGGRKNASPKGEAPIARDVDQKSDADCPWIGNG
jgi:hypothetical protein